MNKKELTIKAKLRVFDLVNKIPDIKTPEYLAYRQKIDDAASVNLTIAAIIINRANLRISNLFES